MVELAQTGVPNQHDTCVIGAGPAGLAVARALKEQGLPYTHLERHSGVGGLWDLNNPGTPLYESAHFISSKTLSGFSGFAMPPFFADYPRHDQILEYLQRFALAYQLIDHIEFNAAVSSVEKLSDGSWLLTRSDGKQTRHDQVVVCTGSQWHPRMIEIPGNFTGVVRHSLTYRSPAEFKDRRVLIIGAGNSGCDIACDAARTAKQAHLSVRRGYWFIPKHIFGMPVDVFASSGPTLPRWLEQRVFAWVLRILQGDLTKYGLQAPDHKLFESHPILNSLLIHHLQHGDITAHPGIDRAEGKTVHFTDGTSIEVDEILLATGFEHQVPVAQEFFGDLNHPDLYLCSFSREHQGLYGVGFVETNSGAYQLFDQQAHMIAHYIAANRDAQASAQEFNKLLATDKPDLSGGIDFISSPRHQGYVDSATYQNYLRELAAQLNWKLTSPPPPLRTAKLPSVRKEVTGG